MQQAVCDSLVFGAGHLPEFYTNAESEAVQPIGPGTTTAKLTKKPEVHAREMSHVAEVGPQGKPGSLLAP